MELYGNETDCGREMECSEEYYCVVTQDSCDYSCVAPDQCPGDHQLISVDNAGQVKVLI